MRRDTRGLWVKPEIENVKIKMFEVSELHEWYAYISIDTLKFLPECQKFYTKPRCEAYEKEKTTKCFATNHQKTAPKIRTTRPLERLHVDLVGPIKSITPDSQFKYLFVTIDDFSG
jgi:hypothetical protein